MLELSNQELLLVKKILRENIPTEIVWAFGSRVNGAPKKYSDLDLVIITDVPLPLLQLSQLREAFEESDLPFQVDLVDWARIKDDFRNIIQENHYPITGQ